MIKFLLIIFTWIVPVPIIVSSILTYAPTLEIPIRLETSEPGYAVLKIVLGFLLTFMYINMSEGIKDIVMGDLEVSEQRQNYIISLTKFAYTIKIYVLFVFIGVFKGTNITLVSFFVGSLAIAIYLKIVQTNRYRSR